MAEQIREFIQMAVEDSQKEESPKNNKAVIDRLFANFCAEDGYYNGDVETLADLQKELRAVELFSVVRQETMDNMVDTVHESWFDHRRCAVLLDAMLGLVEEVRRRIEPDSTRPQVVAKHSNAEYTHPPDFPTAPYGDLPTHKRVAFLQDNLTAQLEQQEENTHRIPNTPTGFDDGGVAARREAEWMDFMAAAVASPQSYTHAHAPAYSAVTPGGPRSEV